jgi:hypothetical protein
VRFAAVTFGIGLLWLFVPFLFLGIQWLLVGSIGMSVICLISAALFARATRHYLAAAYGR